MAEEWDTIEVKVPLSQIRKYYEDYKACPIFHQGRPKDSGEGRQYCYNCSLAEDYNGDEWMCFWERLINFMPLLLDALENAAKEKNDG